MDQKSKNKSHARKYDKAIGKVLSKSKSSEQSYSSINEKFLKHVFYCDVTHDVNLFTHDTQHCPEHMGESTV